MSHCSVWSRHRDRCHKPDDEDDDDHDDKITMTIKMMGSKENQKGAELSENEKCCNLDLGKGS